MTQAVVTSNDSAVSATVDVTQDASGAYVVSISEILPEGTPLIVEFEGARVYEGSSMAGA